MIGQVEPWSSACANKNRCLIAGRRERGVQLGPVIALVDGQAGNCVTFHSAKRSHIEVGKHFITVQYFSVQWILQDKLKLIQTSSQNFVKMNLTGLAKEVADKYRDTLSTLTFNNKIVINTLTEIAKEEIKHAQVVTRVIEERLKRVKPDGMLPIMYLVDSICKNIGGPYNELFQQNLVSNFSYVFQACNEKVRISLYINPGLNMKLLTCTHLIPLILH